MYRMDRTKLDELILQIHRDKEREEWHKFWNSFRKVSECKCNCGRVFKQNKNKNRLYFSNSCATRMARIRKKQLHLVKKTA